LAWAASFILMVGLAGIISTVYRSGQANYTTRTDSPAPTRNVLHIVFHRTVTIGEAEEVLRASGAHIVEGPDGVGVFGVAPGLESSAYRAPDRMTQQLRILSARLRADPRVLWVEPLTGEDSSAEAQEPTPRGP
jgi:hypothetical protein